MFVDLQTMDKGNFNVRSFSRDVLIFSSGQVVLLIFSFIQSLIIPKYLPAADYGYWQLFILYISYAGILHFGFLDGISVKWAGKDLEDLKDEIPVAFRFILLEQGIILVILTLFLSLIQIPFREIALTVLVNAVIVNLLWFFLFTAQATKRFKLLTAANIGKGFLFLIFVLILFFKGYFDYIQLIYATIAAGLIILSIFIFHFRENLFYYNKRSMSMIEYGKENIGIGIFVLLGNFMAFLLTTIDRLTVGSFFSITQFGIYAFATTMCGLCIVFLQAVSQVFFPYLMGSNSEIRTKSYTLLRSALVIFWAGLLAAYFPFSVWIRYYLPQYTDSLSLMAILLCTIGFSGQILILHANFFKVYLKQQAYFVIAGISLIGAVAFNLVAVTIFGSLTAVAVTAVISFSFWYLFNEVTLRHLNAVPAKDIIKWLIIVFAYFGAFLGAYTLTKTWIAGFAIYLVLFAYITIICLHGESENLWSLFREITKRENNEEENRQY